MPNKNAFVNPLLRPSNDKLNIPDIQETEELNTTATPHSFDETIFQNSRRRGKLSFENTHTRVTLWMDNGLKKKLESLADKKSISKTSLINEAVNDLLRKYMQ